MKIKLQGTDHQKIDGSLPIWGHLEAVEFSAVINLGSLGCLPSLQGSNTNDDEPPPAHQPAADPFSPPAAEAAKHTQRQGRGHHHPPQTIGLDPPLVLVESLFLMEMPVINTATVRHALLLFLINNYSPLPPTAATTLL